MRITCKDRITNETIRHRTTGTSVQQNQTNTIKIAWTGDRLWMKDDRLTKSVHQWKPTRKRSEDDQTKDGWTVLKRIYDEPV